MSTCLQNCWAVIVGLLSFTIEPIIKTVEVFHVIIAHSYKCANEFLKKLIVIKKNFTDVHKWYFIFSNVMDNQVSHSI